MFYNKNINLLQFFLGLEEIYNLTNLERFIKSEGTTNNSKKVLIVSFFNIYFTVSKMNL